MKSTISIIKRCTTVLLSLITHRYAAGSNKKIYRSSPGPGSPIFASPFFPALRLQAVWQIQAAHSARPCHKPGKTIEGPHTKR